MTSVKKLTANPFQFIGQPFRRGVWLSSSIMFCALVIWRFVEPAAGTDAGRSYPPERLLTFLESIDPADADIAQHLIGKVQKLPTLTEPFRPDA